MSHKQSDLFSHERAVLFTEMPQNEFGRINNPCEPDFMKLLSPVDCTQEENFLHVIIKKKDAKIKELTRKLKLYEGQLFQTKNQLQTKDYELGFFKQKMREELNKSKELEKEIQKINQKMSFFIESLEVVEKLKNPIQIQKQKQQWQLIECALDKQNSKNRSFVHLNLKSLKVLEKSISKVSFVIEHALKIKKTKRSQPQQKDNKVQKNLDYYYADRL